MTVITDQTAPDAGLVAGIAERLKALEDAVNLLVVQTKQQQGGLALLGLYAALDIFGRIRAAPDPQQALRVYLDITAKNGKQFRAPADDPCCAEIQSGIDNTLAEHIRLLMQFAGELPGGERLQA